MGSNPGAEYFCGLSNWTNGPECRLQEICYDQVGFSLDGQHIHFCQCTKDACDIEVTCTASAKMSACVM